MQYVIHVRRNESDNFHNWKVDVQEMALCKTIYKHNVRTLDEVKSLIKRYKKKFEGSSCIVSEYTAFPWNYLHAEYGE